MANAPFFADGEVIRLGADGAWYSDSTEITHEGTRELFFRSVRREGSRFLLVVGPERKEIQVEDTLVFVVCLDGDAHGGYELVLSDGSRENLDPQSLRFSPGRLVARLSSARWRGEEARFLRAPYHRILAGLEQDDRGYYLAIAGTRVDLANSGNAATERG